MKNNKQSSKKSRSHNEWSFTAGFAVLGLGIGFFDNNIVGGLLVGLGIGLLVTAFLRYRNS